MQATQLNQSDVPQLASALLETGINACTLPVILFAPDDTIAYLSEGFRTYIGAPEHVGNFVDLVYYWHACGKGPQMLNGPDAWLKSANGQRRKHGQCSYQIKLTNGRWFLVNEAVVGEGWVWNFLTDITRLKLTENELTIAHQSARQDADIDPLTGIFNRRFATEDLEKQVRKARIQGQKLSIALVDLDHFKNVNDHFGHAAGDEVLSHFVLTTSWLLRRTDIFARFGGEEFLLVMPDANSGQASQIVERIRCEIADKPIADPDVTYTFSCGVATLGNESASSLLKRADDALYLAKADGRNCTRVAG